MIREKNLPDRSKIGEEAEVITVKDLEGFSNELVEAVALILNR